LIVYLIPEKESEVTEDRRKLRLLIKILDLLQNWFAHF